MLEYFKANPLAGVILAALAVITVFVCIKAANAFSKQRKLNNEIVEKLKADTALRKEFDELTEEKAAKADDERLFKGVALGISRRIEKSENILKEFEALNDSQRIIYSLYFVFEDGSEKLDKFFRTNGTPLTDFALKGAQKLFPEKAAQAFNNEFDAFDENNESASIIPANIERDNAAFSEFINSDGIFTPLAGYIRENLGDFQ